MLNCRICIHREVCKYMEVIASVEEKVKNIRVDGMPEIWQTTCDIKCKVFMPVIKTKEKRRAKIPKTITSYINAIGIEKFDKLNAVEYFRGLGLAEKTAWDYAWRACKYVREIKREKEAQELDESMKKLREQELMLKREIK